MKNKTLMIERIFSLGEDDLPCWFYEPVSDGQDFSCKYEIAWPDGNRTREAWGVDSVQALLLAMQSVKAELEMRKDQEGKDIRWLGGRSLGLPALDQSTAASKD